MCRKRKKRCDGTKPHCTACTSTGKQAECHYSEEDALEGEAQLKQRISELEARLRAYGHREGVDSTATSSSTTRLTPAEHPCIPETEDVVNAGRAFLMHRAQVGLCLTQERLLAIEKRDYSVVHPALLHATILYGTIILEFTNQIGRDGLELESHLLGCAIRELHEPKIDSTTAIEAHQMLCKYYWWRGEILMAREHIMKASHIAIEKNIALLPSVQILQQHSMYRRVTLALDKDVSAICQLLYMDQAQSIACFNPLIFPERYYNELALLPNFYTALCVESFAVAARSISLLLYRTTMTTLSSLEGKDCCDISSAQWHSKTEDMRLRIRQHVDAVEIRLMTTVLTADIMQLRALKIAKMIALGALIEIHAVLAPLDDSIREETIAMITGVISIAQSFELDDYPKLCPLVALPFSASVKVVSEEVRSGGSNLTVAELNTILGEIDNCLTLLQTKLSPHIVCSPVVTLI
ncbi:hypothetical protein CYLTODRAFT_425881 [Cylindrobasidium torrendii FP15055 ss-10]|uniref:Zn(2)-C6 fungal-type domain-containing protein n=1 Tax=Cylindrobasidium torrendii FP15055 ss-10 TaxID=1314674 RepID=A0A0D7AZD0_9AGAR|nr:hypothetical protein CYLTODRAFT_425881 [Cylindrobasidium torrendii FP15055 ss-10]